MDNNLQEQEVTRLAEIKYPKTNVGDYCADRICFIDGYLAALSAQSSNTSDKEVDEDLIDLMQSAMNDNSHESYGRSVVSILPASQDCACIAQSYADKQSMEFAEWIRRSGYKPSHHVGLYYHPKDCGGHCSVEKLLEISKASNP